MTSRRTRRRGAGLLDIAVVANDGTDSSVGNNTTHDLGANTSTGPFTAVLITWRHGVASDKTLVTATWNGDPITILGQATQVLGAYMMGAAIGIIDGGARSGNIVLNMSGLVNQIAVTKLSLNNVASLTNASTPLSATGTDPTVSQGTPGVGGIRLLAGASNDDVTAVTPTGLTELSDFDVSTHRHFAGYVLGNSGTAIGMNAGGTEQIVLGVSLR